MPEKKLLRVVVDTNVLVSALIGKRLKSIIQEFKNGRFVLIFTETTFEELALVIRRPKFARYFGQKEIDDLIYLLQSQMELISSETNICDCRDWKDNIFLECGVDGVVDYIVSGDPDLLTLNPYQAVPIITPAKFLEVVS